MKVIRILGQVLKILSISIIIFAPTSIATAGSEEMPESMKKMR